MGKDINQTKNATEQTVASELNKFNLFEKIAEITSKYGKGTVAFSVIIFFLIINLIINPINLEKILDKWLDKQEYVHQLGLQKRQSADIVIPNICRNILYQSNADRVMILEFHNTGVNKSNLPFYHFSATYEEVNNSIEYVADQYYFQRTGDYGSVIEKIKSNRDLYYGDIIEVESDKAILRMKKNNVRSAYIIGIRDDHNQLIAMMTITSEKENHFDEFQLSKIVNGYTQQIGSMLTGITNLK